ncbi:neutral zinc metallopeptidase [Streptosporangiaceae bacterium NEAU-GS5]|nr:neutral zinc metallopeptidase [Streptosporangiaceae bacterium NEAU-GS5]
MRPPYPPPPPPQGRYPYPPSHGPFPQHSMGPPQGPYGPPRYTPPNWRPQKPKSGAGIVIAAVFGAVAVCFVLLIIAGALLKASARRSTSVSPVAVPTLPAFPARSHRPLPTFEQPTTRPTQRQVTRPARTLNTSLKRNTLYTAGPLPATGCPAGSPDISSHAQLKALILKTGACMGRAWKPALERIGIPFASPGYGIVARTGRGACGDIPNPGTMVPYYCPRNSTIYASTSALVHGTGNQMGYAEIISWHGGIIAMMAHEYGHHIQSLSGLSDSEWQQVLGSGSQAQRLALSRRFELQANCFSGMFMRAVAGSYPVPAARRNQLFYFFSNVGDWPGYPRDHGKPANSGAWFKQGWLRRQAYQCNTWVVGGSTVS